ncbi:MAG: hypothetical protein IIX14_07890 [Clostridia bacterium]|nr:hypothetical protein [Clostridia bacterium]
MENKTYSLPIKTPDGIIKLKINHTVVNKDDENMSVIISTTIQGTPVSCQTKTTEEALILLAKNLPEKWHINSCISCRFGHFCPVGNYVMNCFV